MFVDESGDWSIDSLKWPAQAESKQARRERLRAKVEAWFAASMGMTVQQWREAQAANAARLELGQVMGMWSKAAKPVRKRPSYEPSCGCSLCSYITLLHTPKARNDQ